MPKDLVICSVLPEEIFSFCCGEVGWSEALCYIGRVYPLGTEGNRLKAQLLEMFLFMITQAFVGISFSSIDHNIKHFTKEMFHRRFTLRNRI